jgi:hypothetical protein
LRLQAKRVIEKRSKLKTPGEGIPESKAYLLKYPVSLQTTALIYSSNNSHQERRRSKSAGVKSTRKASRPQTAKQRPQSSATVLKLFESAKRDYKQGQWKRAQDGLKDLLDKVSKQGGGEAKTRFVAKPYNRPKSARPTRHSAFPVSSAFSECDSEGEMDLVSDQELEKIFGEDVAREVVAKSTVIGLEKKKEKLHSRPQSRASTRPSSPIKKPVTIPQPQSVIQQEALKVVPEKQKSKKRPVSARKEKPVGSSVAKEKQVPALKKNPSQKDPKSLEASRDSPPRNVQEVPETIVVQSASVAKELSESKKNLEKEAKELELPRNAVLMEDKVQESLVTQTNEVPVELIEYTNDCSTTEKPSEDTQIIPSDDQVQESIVNPQSDSPHALEEAVVVDPVQQEVTEELVDQKMSYNDDFDQEVEEKIVANVESTSVEEKTEEKNTQTNVKRSSHSLSSSVPDLTKSNRASQPELSSRAELSKSSHSLSRSQAKIQESKSKSNSAVKLPNERILSPKPSQDRLAEKKDSKSTTSLNQIAKAKSQQSLREAPAGSVRNSSSSLTNKVQPIQYTFDSNGLSKTVQGIYGDGSKKGSTKGMIH